MTKEKVGDQWRTPPQPFNTLNREFNFVADMAASPENALCDIYFTEDDDSLSFDWAEMINSMTREKNPYVFCNPPYSNPLPWVKKAVESQVNGLGVVMLLNYDHGVTWFYEALKGVSEIRSPIFTARHSALSFIYHLPMNLILGR